MLRVLVLVTGVLIAGFAALAYLSVQSPTAATPRAAPVKNVAIIATAHPVRAGSLLQPGDLVSHNVPEGQIPAGAERDTQQARNALIGAMVRRMLGDHDVITDNDVLRPGDRGFLAAVLAPGARAISVAVDAVSGEAGLIWPGDRVDLILTQIIEGSDQSMAHRVSGETVLSDVRVIAVDQQLVQGGQASGLLDSRAQGSRTITLEVSPRDSERIAVATRLGKLLVVLRSAQPDAVARSKAPDLPEQRPASAPLLARATQPENGGPVWGGDVSRALKSGHTSRDMKLRLYQGTKQVEIYDY